MWNPSQINNNFPFYPFSSFVDFLFYTIFHFEIFKIVFFPFFLLFKLYKIADVPYLFNNEKYDYGHGCMFSNWHCYIFLWRSIFINRIEKWCNPVFFHPKSKDKQFIWMTSSDYNCGRRIKIWVVFLFSKGIFNALQETQMIIYFHLFGWRERVNAADNKIKSKSNEMKKKNCLYGPLEILIVE